MLYPLGRKKYTLKSFLYRSAHNSVFTTNDLKLYFIEDNLEEIYIQEPELCLFLQTVSALQNDDHNPH